MTGGKWCYPGSDVLINRYDIHDKILLGKLETQKLMTKILSLDVSPARVKTTFDTKHLISVHKYLFEDIYEWAGKIRDENLYKAERVLSGGSAEYSDYQKIEEELNSLFSFYGRLNWTKQTDLAITVSNFLLSLWSIHPFREGNTRTCVTFLWHYLNAKKIIFNATLLRENPQYVRDALVMANYDNKKHLIRIISDALKDFSNMKRYKVLHEEATEQYQIAKTDYEAFRNKYSVKRK